MQLKTKQFLRENLLGLSLTFIGVLSLALAGVLYMGHTVSPRFAYAEGQGLTGPDIDFLERQNRAYERIAEAVTPAIVNIRTTQVVKVQQSPMFGDPFFRQFFGDMFGGVPREQREHALGSGVLLTPDGYIVTNNHVVRRASDIEVMLSDKRTFKAKLVGADPRTDVAVIKIDGTDLPTVPWGDSSAVKVGDTVMAFGNPFGLNFTVTRGTISAKGRSGLGIETYEDFIQTDASINPGNSGGALVNIHGQVVGINTAILSSNSGPGGEGGSVGIGFAIPADLVKHVMDSLVKTGKVERGYLGILPGPLNLDLAKQFNVPNVSGALVNQVEPNSPAEKAGMKAGDVIRTYNGQTVDDDNRLRALVASTNPGTTVTLGILRDGKPMELHVTLAQQPANMSGPGALEQTSALRGIKVQNLTPDLRNQLGLSAQVQGVVISEIAPDSPAAAVQLQPGDVIQSIDRKPITNVMEFNALAGKVTGKVLLQVNRQGYSQFVVLQPAPQNDNGDNGGGGDDDNN
jgi:Do/DeqQ family serine protease